jgi:phospholipid/cholesterol/gamma-HCH transport system substrate-binding protein
MIEAVMGAVVLIVAAVFLSFAYNTSQLKSVDGYSLTANFQRIDGIREGGDVRISGIKVGSVQSETLDPKTYLATVRMNISHNVKLPDDTVAEIVSAGLLGDKYVSLVPGGSDKMIAAGGAIKYTQASVSLENLIGQTIFSPSGSKKSADGGGAPPSGSGSGSGAGELPAPGPVPSNPTPPK